MGLISAILLLAGALAALWSTPATQPLLGLSHPEFAAAAVGLAMLASLATGGGFFALVRSLASAVIWAGVVVGLWFGYQNRDHLGEAAAIAIGSFADEEPTVTGGGEVTIKRSFGGEFTVPAKVNDRPVRFVFDTGASTVVLTAEDAERVGVDPGKLDFSAAVMTANGSALAAPARIARIAIGPIVARNVRALVTRPGAMTESLLGMSFLEELESYKVEKGRLTLTAKKS